MSSALSVGCEGEPAYVGLVREIATCEDDRCFVDDSLRDVVEQFSKAVTSHSLELVYPANGAVHPVNVTDLTVQWSPRGSTDKAFRLRLGEGAEAYDFYVTCLSVGDAKARGCSYRLPRTLWGEAARALAGKSVTLSLWGLGSEGHLVAAPPLTVKFSAAPVEGAFQYWSRSGSAHSLQRVVFGAEGSVPLVTPPTRDNPNACGGCHAASRDGGVIGYTLGEGDPDSAIETNAAFEGKLAVIESRDPDVFLIAPTAGSSDSAMMAFNGDGTRVLTAFNRRLVLRDARSGAALYEVPSNSLGLNVSAFFPEFSPDDSQVVVVLSSDPAAGSDRAQEIAVTNGSIALLDYKDDALGENARILVPEAEGMFHYYPTWSPDGRWIAFVSAEQDDLRDSYARPDARLRLVSVETGAVHELEKASAPFGQSASWPRFAPHWQCANALRDCEPDARTFFFTLSSKRDYGYLRQNGLESDEAKVLAQLWLSTVDVATLGRGEDASSPPLWIPYQEPFQRNYQGSWSEFAACSTDSACGPGASCVAAQCQTIPSK